MNAIHPKIVDVLTGTFRVPAAEIRPDSTMESLEMDSLAVAEFALIVKDALGLDLEAGARCRDATLAEITEIVGAPDAAAPVGHDR
ncbi:acyl carrier protein [uncultured Streptomyces sp.]|uniref:acyl carrier protein n=1 Tax=uncultured Streptomyces sp. TaxID=174707 RepID=UPI0026175683|nr:acyl carrier protein [uncultured Streptomyces sp.]